MRATLSRRAVTIAPAFATVAGGLSRLIAAIDLAMPAACVLLGRTVREIVPIGDRWRVVHGSTHDAQALDVDAVVLAVPSHPAARLLAPFAADAAESVGALDYASIGLVTMLLPAGALDGTSLDGSIGRARPGSGRSRDQSRHGFLDEMGRPAGRRRASPRVARALRRRAGVAGR